MALGFGFGMPRRVFAAPFTPQSLFSTGAQGAWYDPSDMTTLFQDSAGTTPVTAVEQPVGLMLDKSKGATLGPELLTNGSFTTDLNGWTVSTTLTNTVTWVSSGAARLNIQTISGDCSIAQGTFVSGQWYKLSFTATLISGGAIRVQGPLPSAFIFSTTGNYVQYFQATTTGALTFTKHAATAAWDITNVKIAAIPGNHAFQATSASRPVLSARYNLLTKTEQFDDAAWVKTGLQPFGSGSIVNATTAPDGTLTADFICENSSAGVHRLNSVGGVSYIAGTSITSTIRVKSTTRNYSPYLGNASGAITATFNLSNGTVSVAASNIGTASGATASITQDAQGFWLCTLSGVVSTSSSTNAIFYHQIVSGTNTSYTGDGTSGIYIWGASLVPANQSTLPYQRVNTSTDYNTVGFLPYLKFDGVDDSLSTNSINFTSTDKMSVFAGVRKLSEGGGGGLIAELSADSTSNNGSFYVFTYIDSNYYWRNRGTNSVQIGSGVIVAPATNVFTGVNSISTPAETLRINGSQVSTNTTTSQGTGNYGNYPLYIGRRNNASLPFNGQMYSMVIVGKAVTAGELVNTETYTNQKTGAY